MSDETIEVRINRTDGWLYQQRLASGESIPKTVEVRVKPADLSIEARRCILLHDGYRNVLGISYDRDYNTGVCYSNWGIVDLIVDAVTPSTDQISAAILTEMATVQARRAEAEAKRAEAEALAARRQEARLLLADEFDAAAKKLAAAEAVAAQRLTRIGELEDEANDEE